MKRLKVQPLPRYWRVADKLLAPVMWALRGFKTDSLQETHPWHVQQVSPNDIDLSLAVLNQGTDNSKHGIQDSFWFHAPIFGGWKNYSVFEVDRVSVPFHIGWIVRQAETGDLVEAAVQRLPIYDTQVRMLDGQVGNQAYFFAVDQAGTQVPLQKVGHGRLDDGQFLNVRLF